MRVSLQEVKIESVSDAKIEHSERSAVEYVETTEKDYHQVDALSQLKANVSKLSELQFKMQFMMGEVSSLVSKK